MTPIRFQDGRLMVEDVPASELAERFGTPLYVTSEAQLRANARAWIEALEAAWPYGRSRVLVSLKANPSLALRAVLNDEGAGCDVFGEAELEVALRAGVAPEQISVNGSTKPRSLIERAVELGARVTADSVEELAEAAAAGRRLGRTALVRVRLRPDLTDVAVTSEFTEAAPLGEVADAYKPGIPIERLLEALPAIDLTGAELTGVHAHLGRHTSDVEPFRLHARRLAGLVLRLHEALDGWRPSEIDAGGGYSYAGDPTGLALRPAAARTPEPGEYAAAIASSLADALGDGGLDPRGIALELEPGRAVYGNAGLHLATVLNVKRQTAPAPRSWVGCDSSEVYLSDISWEHARWQPVCAEPVAGEPQPVDVTGVSCGFDTIAADAPLPAAIAAGDVLAFLATGAYEEALAGNFNSMPRPAAVLVSGSATALTRRRETVADVIERDLMPARLGGRRALGVDHVSVTVADLDRSLAFYTGPLGLRLHDRGDIDPALIERMTGRPGLQVEYADVELGTRVLELLCYRSPAPALPATTGTARPGAVHIGVAVADAAAVHARLTAAGTRPLSDPVLLPEDGSGWAGALVFYVRDPDGVTIEIVQHGSGAGQRQRELDRGSLARH